MSDASGFGFIFIPRRAVVAALFVAAAALAGCAGPEGPAGPAGDNGSNGTSGASCSLTDNHDGTSTIRCPDGTSVTVPTGSTGTACTVTTNDNGTRTITCDGTTVVVQDAVVDYQTMTADELKASLMAAAITSVTIPEGGHPVVTLKVSDRHGLGVKGLGPVQLAPPSPPNPLLPVSWRFALLKLDTGVNTSIDETWVSYIADNNRSTASTETATAATLADNHDGTYTYTFAKNIAGGIDAAGTLYEPTKLHRLVILMSAGGNPFSPVNLIRDFTPSTGVEATGSHEKFDGAACLECHTSFRAIADGTGAFGSGEFHSGGRYDTRSCVACHNDQRRFTSLGTVKGVQTVDETSITGSSPATATWPGNLAVLNGEAVINLPVFIHKIHRGEQLALKGGTYSGIPKPYETTYPQDIRNCTKCHRNPSATNPAPLADNWKIPSRRACGSCHDDRSFINLAPPHFDPLAPPGRIMHSGGAQANDNQCLVCHSSGGLGGAPDDVHAPVSKPNPENIYLKPLTGTSNTNAAYVAAAGFVPPGATALTYEVQTVTLDATRHPKIVFRILKSNPMNPTNPSTAVTFQTFGPGVTEMIPGFVGSPSAYFVYAVKQDGIDKPADFNVSVNGYIRNIWNGSATGSLSPQPDANGFYTLVLTSSTAVVPQEAAMFTGGIGYTYSLGSLPLFADNAQPFTEIDMPSRYPFKPNSQDTPGAAGVQGGLIVPAPDVWKVGDGFTARRTIVDNKKCAACHQTLGVGPDFHAGQRNDAPTCSFCHRPNQTSSGWSANAKDFIHGIHAAEKRAVKFNWHAPSATDGYYKVTYPAILNRCEMCHVAGTYDFSLSSTTTALPNMLPSTVGVGRYNGNGAQVPAPAGWFAISSYVQSDTLRDYGYGFSTAPLTPTLPDGISGTQNGNPCTPLVPCVCTTANPCSVTLATTYKVNNADLTFTQVNGLVTTTCGPGPGNTCTCTNALPCTAPVVSCSKTTPCDAQGTTLINTPIAAACVACHDGASAIDHMQTNGASIWETRAAAANRPQKEECLICHGPNRLAAISVVHTDRTP